MRRIRIHLIVAVALFGIVVSPALGQLDPTFGTNGVATADTGVDDTPLASFVLPDGKILVVSQADWVNGNGPFKLSFIRFNSNGTLDSSYGTGGIKELAVPVDDPVTAYISGAARQADGKIVLVGKDNIVVGIVARYNEDGTLDSNFADGGIHRPNVDPLNREFLTGVIIQPDGKILVAGATAGSGDSLYLLRYLPGGGLDPTFGSGGSGYIIHTSVEMSFRSSAEFFALQSTGKIIVGNRYADGPEILRFNADGTLDATFTPISLLGNAAGGNFFTASVQSDDKLLVGTRSTYNDSLLRLNNDSLIARYNADGTPDTGFGIGGNLTFDLANYQPETPIGFRQMADGQILVAVNVAVGPNRSSFRGSWLGMARLSATGTLNGKFLAAKSHADRYSFTTILPDGKILTTYKTTVPASDIMVVRAVGVPLSTYKFRGVPFDFGPLGKSSPSVYRSSTRRWYSWQNLGGEFFGLADDIPIPSDYLGNFQSELAVFRPSDGTWYVAKGHSNPAQNYLAIRWGLAGDIPLPNDFDGDGKSDLAVFRPSDGNWYINNSSDGSYAIQHWGTSGDKPAAGDFDGDGRYDLAVYRPSQGTWYIYRSSDGGYSIVNFGLAEDIPVQEDYDGDGKTDIAVYRPSTGVWYRLNSSDGSYLDYPWGISGDIPVPGDYDADGKTNIAVFRPSAGIWYVVNPDMVSMHDYLFGMSTDTPLPGKF